MVCEHGDGLAMVTNLKPMLFSRCSRFPVSGPTRGLNQLPSFRREGLLLIAAWGFLTAFGISSAAGQTREGAVCIEVCDSLNQPAADVHVEVASSAGLEFCGATAQLGQTAWFGVDPETALTCTLFPMPLSDGQLLGAVFSFTLPFQKPDYALNVTQGYCMPRAQRVQVRGAAESITYFTQANDYPFWSLITPKNSNANFDCSVATLVGPLGIAATARFHGFGDRVAAYRRGAALVSESVALGTGKGGGLVVLIEINEGIEESEAPLVKPTIDVIRCTPAPKEGQPLSQPKLTLIPCPAGPGEVGVALLGELQAGTHFFLVRETDGIPGRLIDVLDQAPTPLPQPPSVPTPPAPSPGDGCLNAVGCEANLPGQPAEPGDSPSPPRAAPRT